MSVFSSRSSLGNAVKRAKAEGCDPSSDGRVEAARRGLAEEKIRKFVEVALAEAPPLSSEQLNRLRGLFVERHGADTAEPPHRSRQTSRTLGGGAA